MIKKAIEKIEEMTKTEIYKIGDLKYTDKVLHRIKSADTEPEPKVIEVHTLTGILDYCKNNLDFSTSYTIHIESHNCVKVYGEYEKDFGRRKHYITANFKERGYQFGQPFQVEDFIINLQSQFDESKSKSDLMAMVSQIVDEESTVVNDDGITQNVVIKTGIQKLENAEVPNPVKLKPFRTFPEIEQVESFCVLRIKKMSSGPHIVLFESDGGTWKLDIIHAIRDYFNIEVTNFDKPVYIIA